ncbi:MAG: S46 family peptidase [Bacteroidales bacterium]|nr:S46 family peptidase [Bacteroidales bacterium]
MLKRFLFVTALAVLSPAIMVADEGMWLLPFLKQQNSESLKKLGLKLEVDDIYSPDEVSLKDAIVVFGKGCTGEVISDEGLILTNHHCGYSWIQQHSSVDHDYLTDGFWAYSKSEELPTPGLEVRFIDRIVDVTDSIKVAVEEAGDPMKAYDLMFLNKMSKRLAGEEFIKENPFVEVVIKPFYGGNKFFMFYQTVYKDVRMVGTPPSSIGKFGYDTDNWMWPRHTGDFSLFRVYTDKDGKAAEYSADNIPMKPKHHLPISLKGVEQGDYSMTIGFPGTTNRYDISEEIIHYRDIVNAARIEMRGVRLDVLEKLMQADDKVRIQYASKYASSSNYWKNAIGMNRGIKRLSVIDSKLKAEKEYRDWAYANNMPQYAEALDNMITALRNLYPIKYQRQMMTEGLSTAVEFSKVPSADALIKAIESKDKEAIDKEIKAFKEAYAKFNNKDYDPEVDRQVAKAMIKKFISMFSAEERPDVFAFIDKKYKGDTDKFIDDCFDKSVFADSAKFNKFMEKPSAKVLKNDLMLKYANSVRAKIRDLAFATKAYNKDLTLAKQVYIEGLLKMREGTPVYPDANFTIRLSAGQVQPYKPADAVSYNFFTTMEGIFEKEDSTNYEFEVPAKLKEIWLNKDYGRYAEEDGRMIVNIISSNDITGGNSGSPLINGNGELIGLAFDGNWEAMSGDIIFEPNMQRTISVDIRYVMLIIEKFAGAMNIIDEIDFVE